MNSSRPLENIGEDLAVCLPSPAAIFQPPETPKEPMEFLARSWSISALEVSKALAPLKLHGREEERLKAEERPPITAPFVFGDAETSQIVKDRVLSESFLRVQNVAEVPHSFSAVSDTGNVFPALGNAMSPDDVFLPFGQEGYSYRRGWIRLVREYLAGNCCLRNLPRFCTNLSSVRTQLRGKTMGRWLKEKKKEENRAQNAQTHAAMSVAGVAAAVAAIAASTATSYGDEGDSQTNTSMAVASAAALVAAECVEVAVCMGADREQMASVVSSAVNVKTPGDVMTLTAGAATALRGAATLQVRALKEVWNNASVIPYDKGSNPTVGFSGELAPEDGETEPGSQDLLARGCQLLKRTRKGNLHWKLVFVYIKNAEVVVKLKSKHMGGTFTKKKKSVVFDVCKDLPAWPGRDLLEGGQQRCYFGLKTAHGVIQFECRNKRVHQICTEGVARLLSLTQQQKMR